MKTSKRFTFITLNHKLIKKIFYRDAKNMARDVNNIIAKICQTEGGMTQSEGEAYVKKMINQKRYSSDVWS